MHFKRARSIKYYVYLAKDQFKNIFDAQILQCQNLSLAIKIKIEHIASLKEILMSFCQKEHNAKRVFSTLIFGLLRLNDLSYNLIQKILSRIGYNYIRTATH